MVKKTQHLAVITIVFSALVVSLVMCWPSGSCSVNHLNSFALGVTGSSISVNFASGPLFRLLNLRIFILDSAGGLGPLNT